MGYADQIGQALPRPTVGDLEKARTSRQVQAERWLYDHPHIDGTLREEIAVWITTGGGSAPWEKPPADVAPAHAYPPIKQTRSRI